MALEHHKQVFDLERFLLLHQVEELAQYQCVCSSNQRKVNWPSLGEWWLLAELAITYSLEVPSKGAEFGFVKQFLNTFHVSLLLYTVLLNVDGLFHRCGRKG